MQRPFSSLKRESEVIPVRLTAYGEGADIFFVVPDGSLELCQPWPGDPASGDLDQDPPVSRRGSFSFAQDGGAAPRRVGRIRSSEDERANRWAANSAAEVTLRHVPGGWDRVAGKDPQLNLPHRDPNPLRLPWDARPPCIDGLVREAELAPREGITGA